MDTMKGRRIARREELVGRDAFRMDLYLWLQALVWALSAMILLFTLVGRVVGVDGSSMLPTLQDRDTMLLYSAGYVPKQGDVVVLTKYFEEVRAPIVKRVIAAEGQTVEIDYAAGTVAVDGMVLSEPYITEPMRRLRERDITFITVPPGHIFVMGDNRNHSNDSRNPALGTVDKRYVLGKVLAVLLPPGHFQIM